MKNFDDYIWIRGIPVSKAEVVHHQQNLGAQLFDESVFPPGPKRKACANVINELDKALRVYQEKQGGDLTYLPEYVDIGDRSWFYVPVAFPFSATPTKDRPVTMIIGWFRRKRIQVVKRGLYV